METWQQYFDRVRENAKARREAEERAEAALTPEQRHQRELEAAYKRGYDAGRRSAEDNYSWRL